MKNALLSCIVMVYTSVNTYAQITLTQSDAPVAGESWAVRYADFSGKVSTGPTGANVTWNFSSAVMNEETESIDFLPISAVPAVFSDPFPNATLAQYYPEDTIAQFFRSAEDGFYLDGIHDRTAQALGVIDYSPDLPILPTPFTYGDSKNATVKAIVYYSQLKYVHTEFHQFNSDGWGTLITPVETFSNVLRIKDFSYSIDSIFISLGMGNYVFLNTDGPQDTTCVISWFKNGPQALVANTTSYDLDVAAELTSSISLFNPSSALGTKKIHTNNTVRVFPNPSHSGNNVTFDIENPASANVIAIYNLSGQLVKKLAVEKSNKVILYTKDIQPGAYIYSILSSDGQPLQNGKFQIID